MKLPGITYTTGVASLGQHDIGAPARVAAAKGRKYLAMADAVGAIGSAYEMYDTYDKQQAEEASKDNSLELQKRSLQFHKEFDERDFYPSDHPYVTNTPGFENDNRDSIPAHEIRPAAYRAYMESAIEELSPNIHRQKEQDNWRRDSESRLIDSVTRFTLESLDTRKQAYTQKLFDQIDEARQQQSYGVARQLSEDDALTEDQRRDQNKVTEWDEETDAYERAKLSDNPEYIQAKIDELEEGTYTGVLTPKEQRQYRDQLRARLDTTSTRATLKDKRDRSNAVKDAKTLEEKENRGYITSPDIHAQTRNELDRTEAGGTSARDLDESQEDMLTVNKFSKLSLSRQKTFISELKQNPNMDPSQIRTTKKLEAAHGLNVKSVKTDMMAHAGKLGLVDLGPIVMDGSQEDFYSSLLKRGSDFQEIKMLWGSGNGMLSEEEAIEMSAWFKSIEPPDQAMLITSIHDFNPEIAGDLFEQLKADDPSAYQSAANAFADGRNADASAILQGAPMVGKMVDADGSPNRKYVEKVIREEMGAMYGADHRAKESAVVAALAIIARDQSLGKHNIDESDTFGSGSYVKDIITKVTRGQVEIDDSITVGPGKGKTEDDIVEWKNTIDPGFMKKLTRGHGIDGMTNEEFVYKLRAGEFDWHYVAPGQWRLTYENIDGVDITLQLADGEGTAFILEYDETITDANTSDAMDEVYLEEENWYEFSDDIDRLKPEYRTKPDATTKEMDADGA